MTSTDRLLMLRRTLVLLFALLPAFALVAAVPTASATTVSIRTVAHTVSASVPDTADLRLPAAATHVATYWQGNPGAHVRVAFSIDGRAFTAPVDAGRDEVGEQRGDGVTYGAVQLAAGARVVRVTTDRPLARLWVDGMADGQRVVTTRRTTGAAHAAVGQPTVSPRSAWGADESLRYNPDGTLKAQPTYFATKKLIVHHTATANGDPDPAATIRAIYRYHVETQKWADIGYNFLIDESGRTWEGRWSRNYPAGTAPSGDDEQGRGVTGSHTGGWNSGTMGVALLATLSSQNAAPAARTALVDLLAWESEKNGLDPKATTAFINPVSGASTTTPNIAGHQDYVATDCPGGSFYTTLPALRDEVAARIGGAVLPIADVTAPTTPTGVTASVGSRSIALRWDASTDDRAVSGYAVLRSTTGKPGSYAQVATSTTTSFTDTGLRSGKRYWYGLQAYDAAGNRSPMSATVSATAG